MNKKIEECRNSSTEPDVEMEAIGYPPPLNPAAFARKLAEIIKRGLKKGAS
jgi:hypothetical protein